MSSIYEQIVSEKKKVAPVEVVIFDRNRLYGSDVPVFSQSLKKKVNTPASRDISDGLSKRTEEILKRLKKNSAEVASDWRLVSGEQEARTQDLELRTQEEKATGYRAQAIEVSAQDSVLSAQDTQKGQGAREKAIEDRLQATEVSAQGEKADSLQLTADSKEKLSDQSLQIPVENEDLNVKNETKNLGDNQGGEEYSAQDISFSRADSFGGQTNEFAQGKETLHFSPTIHGGKNEAKLQQPKPARSAFFEEPTLIRTVYSAETLRSFLRAKVVPVFTIPQAKYVSLQSTHQRGLVDTVVLPIRQVSFIEYFEPFRYGGRRVVAKASAQYSVLSAQGGTAVRSLISEISRLVDQMITIERPQATEHRLQEVTDSSAQYSGLRWAELTSDSEGVEHSSLEKKNVILPNQLGRNSSEERTREERSSRIGEEKVASRYTPSAVSSKLKASFSSRCSYLFTLANSYFRVTGSRIRLLVAAFTGMTGGRLQSLLSLLFSQLSAVGSGLQAISSKLKALIRRQYEQFSLVALASRTLIAGSMVLMLLTVGPMVALEAQSWRQHIAYSIQNMSTKAADQGKKELETPTPSATAQPTPTPNPAPDRQFQVVIPKIGVDSKVIADVDPGNEKEYTKALKEGVAHAKGTGYPGQENSENKTTFLFAHSTNGTWNIARYNALFYGLKDMNTGDDFSLWYKGQEYTYVVTEKKVVEPTDVSFLLPQHEKDQLILQTCWPPGTSAKRLLVIAEAR